MKSPAEDSAPSTLLPTFLLIQFLLMSQYAAHRSWFVQKSSPQATCHTAGNLLQHSMTKSRAWYSLAWRTAAHHGTAQHATAWHMQHSAAQRGTARHSAAPPSTAYIQGAHPSLTPHLQVSPEQQLECDIAQVQSAALHGDKTLRRDEAEYVQQYILQSL